MNGRTILARAAVVAAGAAGLGLAPAGGALADPPAVRNTVVTVKRIFPARHPPARDQRSGAYCVGLFNGFGALVGESCFTWRGGEQWVRTTSTDGRDVRVHVPRAPDVRAQ